MDTYSLGLAGRCPHCLAEMLYSTSLTHLASEGGDHSVPWAAPLAFDTFLASGSEGGVHSASPVAFHSFLGD